MIKQCKLFTLTFVFEFSRSLIRDIEAHYQDPTKPYPSEDSPLMSELSTYLESAGVHDPLKKV